MKAWAVCRRELVAYFRTPTAYVVLAVYLALAGYFFTTYAVLARRADLRDPLGNIAVVFLFLAPALTTRLWAEEARQGTDELLLTLPAGLAQVVLGKFAAAAGLFGAFLLLTGIYPAFLEYYGDLDWGATLAGYLGLVLLGAAALAAGLFASSLTDSPAVAAVLGFGILLMFWVAGWVGEALPGAGGQVLQWLSLTPHYQDFAMGVLEWGHLTYFATLVGAFLFLTVQRLESRRGRRRASAAVFTAGVLALLVMANVLAARHPARWDLTADRQHSLSEATRTVLGRLPGPVTAIGFYEPGSVQARQLEDLFRAYAAASGGKVSFRAVDPVAAPALVEKYQVLDYGTTVLVAGERTEKLDPWDLAGSDPEAGPAAAGEQAVTTALLRLTQGRPRTVYFLQGHGERSLHDDYREARRALEAEGYQVSALNLVFEPAVPADADAVVVAGPRRDLDPGERQALEAWAGQGKSLVAMVDPLPGNPPTPNLEAVLRLWGVALEHNQVVDPARNFLFDQAAPVPVYRDHSITGKLEAGQLAVVLPGARSLRTSGARGARQSPLLLSSDQAWATTDPGTREIKPNPARDLKGPFTLAVAVEFPVDTPVAASADALPAGSGTAGDAGGAGADTGGTAADTGGGAADAGGAPAPVPGKGVFVGSSAFAVNDPIRLHGNLDFFVNAINWATARSDGLDIRPRPLIRRDLLLTGRDVRILFWTCVAGLPLLVLGSGGAVWWQRRHL